jgi:hypothetical protein
MADQKLSELTLATGAVSSDLLYVVQGATSKKIAFSSVVSSISALIDISSYATKTFVTGELTSYTTNVSLTSTLNSYTTNANLTSTLTAYSTNANLTSTLASYTINANLTSTLASYTTNANLTSTLAAYSTTDTFTSVSVSSGILTLNFSYDYAKVLLDQNVVNINFVNVPTTGTAGTILLEIEQNSTGGYTMAGSSFLTAGGVGLVISATVSATSVVSFTSRNGGNKIFGISAGRDWI